MRQLGIQSKDAPKAEGTRGQGNPNWLGGTKAEPPSDQPASYASQGIDKKEAALAQKIAVRLKLPAGGKLKARSPASKRLGHEASDMPLALLLGGWRQPFPFLGRVRDVATLFRRNAAAFDHEGLLFSLHRRIPSQTRNASTPAVARTISHVTTISATSSPREKDTARLDAGLGSRIEPSGRAEDSKLGGYIDAVKNDKARADVSLKTEPAGSVRQSGGLLASAPMRCRASADFSQSVRRARRQG